MGNNLYYTPTIEEFYANFEFEYSYTSGKLISTIEPESGWKKDTFDWQWSETINDDWEHENEDFKLRYRVKYLDQYDIESLGWKYDVNMSESEYGSFYIEPGYDEKNRFIQYSLQNYRNGKIYLDKCINSGVHEIGFLNIKNKSELIKLMKQLNIK